MLYLIYQILTLLLISIIILLDLIKYLSLNGDQEIFEFIFIGLFNQTVLLLNIESYEQIVDIILEYFGQFPIPQQIVVKVTHNL